MSRIDDLIAELCPNGIEFKSLAELGEFIRGNGLQKKDLTDEGIGAIHYGEIHTHYGTAAIETRSFVDKARASRLRKARPGDLVIATTSEDDDAVAKAVAWMGQDEVAVSSDAYIYRHGLDPKYLSYFLQSDWFQSQKKRLITGTKVRRVSGDSLSKIRIPVPPSAIQQEVTTILTKTETLEADLQAELKAEVEARRQQYEHYRHSLLTRHVRDRVTMGDAFVMRAGQHIPATQIADFQSADTPYPCYGGNGIRGYVGHRSHAGQFLLVGRQGALCGNVKRARGEFYATEHAVVVAPKPQIDVDWAFHMLTLMDLNQYATKSAQPGLAVGKLQTVPIAVPPIEDQRKIGATLACFDALVNGLSIALRDELKARRRQYEHYRDALFNFEEAA